VSVAAASSPILKCLAFGMTHQGCVRAANEDAFLSNVEAGVWAVADGMGGHGGGDIASARVIAALSELGHCGALPLTREAAVAALKQANKDLHARGRNEFGGVIGATVAVLIARGGAYACLWAGDSRIYRLRAGELRQLTHDHRYVQDLIDAGVLSEGEAHAHPRANVITRAVGAAARLDMAMVEGDMRAGDRYLLCSDGLSNVVAASDIADALRRTPLQFAVTRLMQHALARGAPDNVTALAVTVG
jgi:serine/threonine-protein phosphatase Stp1